MSGVLDQQLCVDVKLEREDPQEWPVRFDRDCAGHLADRIPAETYVNDPFAMQDLLIYTSLL